jgi:predicted ArsR family transcriptional regulator
MDLRADAGSASRAARHDLLSHPTRLAIVDALVDGPRGVSELAEIAEVHPNTVRAHLQRLDEAGLLEVESLHRGGRGRPTKQYRLRQPLDSNDPHLRLLIRAVVSLARRAPHQSAAATATEEGFHLGRELGRRFASGDPADHTWVVGLLEHLSFAPQIRHEDGQVEIDLLHCPFWDGPAEQDGDVVCSFHLGVLQGAATSAGHDPQCVALSPFVEPRRCQVTLQIADR